MLNRSRAPYTKPGGATGGYLLARLRVAMRARSRQGDEHIRFWGIHRAPRYIQESQARRGVAPTA